MGPLYGIDPTTHRTMIGHSTMKLQGGDYPITYSHVLATQAIDTNSLSGARCSFVVRAFAHGAMGRRIDPSWGGSIKLFLVPGSAPRLVKQRPWYVLSCLWDGAYKRTLAVNRKQ